MELGYLLSATGKDQVLKSYLLRTWSEWDQLCLLNSVKMRALIGGDFDAIKLG